MDFKTASAHGQTFRFCDSGEGPPVVLIHGFPDTPMGWEDTRLALNAAGFRTIVPYLRGYHPETIVAGRSYGGDEIGEDAIRLLDALDLERAVLVGHDWGASVVYRAAAMAPERVRGICAVAIPHLRLLGRSPSLLWRGRHFITLALPTGPWLARRASHGPLGTRSVRKCRARQSTAGERSMNRGCGIATPHTARTRSGAIAAAR